LPVLLPVLSRAGAPGHAPPTSWLLPGLALAETLAALGLGHLTRQPTAAQPQQTQLAYALDAARGRAYWVSAADRPDAYTHQVLNRPQYAPLPARYPPAGWPVLHQAAPVLPLAPPTLTVLADGQVAGHRRLRLRLIPGRAAVGSLAVQLNGGGHLLALRIADQPVPATSLPPGKEGASFQFFAPRPGGEELELELAGAGPVRLAITTSSLGLPATLAPALPATMVPAPGFSSFITQVRQDFQL